MELVVACFLSPIVAVLAAVVCYPRIVAENRRRGNSEGLASDFIGGVFVYGLVIGAVGYILGFVFFCLILSWGEDKPLCGLGAVFTAPVGFSLGVAWFLFKSLRRAP